VLHDANVESGDALAAVEEAVKELAAEGNSTRAIGDILGVDHKTALHDLAGENSPTEHEKSNKDGDGFPLAGENSPHNHRAQGTGDNEWYTPPLY
jgi:hypothetical protein